MTEEPARRPRSPLWLRASPLPLVALGAAFVYLGLRPGGRGPIWMYSVGIPAIGLLGFAQLAATFVHGVVRRPFLRRGRFRALFLLAAAPFVASFPFPYPSSREGEACDVRLVLPFEGEWVVRWGGEGKARNALVLLPDRRYGFDFVVEPEGAAAGTAPEGGLGRRVLAPAAGEVVRVSDGAEGTPELGSHLVLEVAAGDFCFLSNLERGSVRVAVGDAVEVGDELARVGRSARSPWTSEPYLGVHVQTTAEPRWGEGVPVAFRDYVADGRPVASGVPRGGVGRGGELLGERVRPGPDAGSEPPAR